MSEIQQVARELLALQNTRARGKRLDEDQSRARVDLLARLRGLVRDLAGSADERRRFLRVSAPLEVVFRVGETTITAAASEMSLGGLSLRGHLWLITEQQMRIESLRVADEIYPLRVRCRVAWRVSAQDGMPRAGLQFVDIDDEAHAQIRAIFEALFRRFLERIAAGEAPTIEDDNGGSSTASAPRTAAGKASMGGKGSKGGKTAKASKASDGKAAKASGKASAEKTGPGKASPATERDRAPSEEDRDSAKPKKETAEYGSESRRGDETKRGAKESNPTLGPRQRVSDRKW